ncbi:glycosyltransferase family 1 protein [Flavobacterium paronense]|uniref:Glycosyltransferase family 4 protein n=1 Tax=Flavobacterium paronense TaxID=1392775 RepID=A0ABV5GEQ4_9FLAO|nr:glycosyltransferase family 1 protein [Flavobacterium paronense]MDN3678428.1 glycosyltransferase family 1 protein [Flavobacterium paronense]
MKTKNIFVDCHVFDGNFQGTTTYLKGLYTELLKDKTKLFYFGASNIAFLKTIFGTHDNLTYVSYKSKNKFYRLLFDIPGIIKKNNIDFAHFQYVVPPIKSCKYIVTIHDVLFLDFPEYFPLIYRIKNKFLFKTSAKRSDVVLSVSEYSKKQIQKHFGIEKVTITPNAIDSVYFETYNKEEVQKQVRDKFKATNYFLYVSRWEPRKNHDRLLKAFVENEYYKTHSLVFVGNKAIENKVYNDYYTSLPDEIKATIFSFSKVNSQDLLVLVRGADLSIYPSIAEGFGIPPLESLAANIPTICSNTTAMADFEFFGDCLFNPLDLEDLKNKIKIGLNDTQMDQKRNQMKAKFTWQFAAEQFKKAIS